MSLTVEDKTWIQGTVTKAVVDAIEALVLPHFDAINERFSRIEQRLDKIDERVSAVEFRLNKVEKRLGKIEKRFDHLAAI